MDELHKLDLTSGTWSLVSTKGPKPAPRYLHTAVLIGNSMVIYGGNNKACGDVWSFNLVEQSWTKLSEVHACSTAQYILCTTCTAVLC